MRKFFLFILGVSFGHGVWSQEVFSGRLHYEIEYLNVTDDMAGVDSMLPKSLNVITDGTNWRIEQHTDINGDVAQIYVASKDSIYETLIIGPERVTIECKKAIAISETNKIGAGEQIGGMGTDIYKCSLENGRSLDIICLSKYQSVAGLFYQDMMGIPTSVELDKGGVTMRLTLKSLVFEPLDETYFSLPTDYSTLEGTVYQSWLR